MKFIKTKYYNEELLGEDLYHKIHKNHEVLTVQEFFNINNTENKYHVKDKNRDYKLMIFDNYYQLDCKNFQVYLFLVFDKPVHITGKHCSKIIAPEIIINSNQNSYLSYCVANKVLIHNSYKNYCEINYSKIKNINFYNERVRFYYSEIDNFFILNKELIFDDASLFLNYHKIKCFGECEYLKNKILKLEHFKNRIIHIE